MNLTQTFDHLESIASPQYLVGMARFGIDNSKALGVAVPFIRKLAKEIKKDHGLALQLWDTGIHEACLLATMIADPAQATPELMDNWVNDFDTWDICNHSCGNLFDLTPFVIDKAFEYSLSELEYVKRAGFG